MQLFTRLFFGLILLAAVSSCSRKIISKTDRYSYAQMPINTAITSDRRIDSMIAPQKHVLDSLMNVVLTQCPVELLKDKPTGTLNNFAADMMLHIGRKIDSTADVAIVNYGGIRLSSLPKGNITVGKIYELLPFDNMVVLQKMNGQTLYDVAQYIAAQGGWPVAGLSFEIKNKKAVNIKVRGLSLELGQSYNVVLSDYLANGGDNLIMLKSIAQNNSNQIMRVAFIEELRKLKSIQVNDEKRIINVD